MWSEPTGSAVVASVAVSGEDPESGAVPKMVDPWVKVTVPLGVAPEGEVCTVAVNDTDAPEDDVTAGTSTVTPFGYASPEPTVVWAPHRQAPPPPGCCRCRR